MTLLRMHLLNGADLATLCAAYSLKTKRHGRYPNLVLVKYDQINSPLQERLVQECRGIILDEADDWRVISRGFDKFFNYGEPGAADIDWESACVQEKLDGSLCTLYRYRNEWHVATTGTPDASGSVNGLGMTFADLFWETWRAQGLSLPDPWGWGNSCLLFELTSPYNRIVVRHDKPRLTLLAVRHRDTGGYQADDWSECGYPYPTVRSFPLQTIADIQATFDHLDPVAMEGYVVVDRYTRRIKVKHPGYVAIHHLKDGFGPRRMLEIVRAGETTELLAHFPEWAEEFREIETLYNSLVNEIDADYERLKDIPVQKDFALQAVKTQCSSALFIRRSQGTSVREFLAGIHINRLLDMLGLRDREPVALEEAA
jgi:hypothetical protein